MKEEREKTKRYGETETEKERRETKLGEREECERGE